jgi:transcriptional regulator with XRE-family HTH domain
VKLVHNIAINLYKYREASSLTQSELAKKAKVSQSTIAHIEIGKKSPSFDTLEKLAIALELHPFDLLKDVDD